ncbi:copper resistance-associated P-type ATPase, putative [Talaromyces stipitatus ATCC 10500]|uniref:Copper resistance-associated P-type ATPase, putative n=1 Tax=Talaromyces stipitatus (strain ATCC 10500 / CBS 375.48 / QM 6759 / NRRL 1006) TaxID=441959 RepID=B8M7Y4_TALSN|nr:copper resistance-associated P-type ATPase, putative [Talaromyces stipitatus ATCC 10500]EED19863.1 copper resistance-associated P-type ATPase, putative [Talaromyces stipitatus ATCC 10500]
MASKSATGLITVLLATNIHCASCVALVKEVLTFYESITSVDVSVLQQQVRIQHGPGISASDLARTLIDAAFEVQIATTQDEATGQVLESIDTSSWGSSPPVLRSPLLSPNNCKACQTERQYALYEAEKSPPKYDRTWMEKLVTTSKRPPEDTEKQPPLESVQVTQPHPPDVFQARISISGMTCGACANSVTEMVQQLGFVKDVSVTLLTNSAVVTFTGPRENIDKIIDEVESTGFDAAVDTLENVAGSAEGQAVPIYEAQFGIGGMTCASCVNAVTHHVKQLDNVKDVTVSLLTNSATVVFSGDQSYSKTICDEIEAIGYDASLIEVVQQNNSASDRPMSDKYIANISINGMSCGACVGKVTQAVQGLSYVKDVAVDLLSSSARVEFEGRDNVQNILNEIEDIGYEATLIDCKSAKEELASKSTERTVMIRVDGMFCHHCPEKVLLSLKDLDDSIQISKDPTLKDPIVKVTYTPTQPNLTIRRILAIIDSSHENFKASLYHPPSIEDRSRAMQLRERRRFLFRLAFVLMVAIPTFIIGIVFMDLVPSDNPAHQYLSQPILGGSVSRMEWAMFFATTPVMFYGADVFHIRAMKEVHALWRPGSKVPILRRFYRFGSMNLLISAGTSVAYIASLGVLIAGATTKSSDAADVTTYFDSVVFLTLFILAGRALEAYSKSKAGDAVSDLGKLRPSEALLVDPSSSTESVQRTNVDLLEFGDVVIIPHGASPPADGIVTSSGDYQFDESSLTGESRPVSKSTGDEIYSGSVNVGQQVSIKVTEVGGASMLDKIVSVVREGQSKRAPMERIADLIVAYFVPVITLIAILTFIIWLALGQSGALPLGYLDTTLGGWTFWSLQFAIAVFVVACPCGLALAAPTALFVGVGLAAKRGILVRGGGEAFQEATRLDAIVFDKTGTLTEGGNLRVSEHEVLDNSDPQKVAIAWTLARELEQTSNHPIAKAIVEFCKDKLSGEYQIGVKSSDILEISGQGMKGKFTISVNGENATYEAVIGNERLAKSVATTTDSQSYFFANALSKYQSSGRSTAVLLLHKFQASTTTSPKDKETGANTIDTEPFIPTIIFATSDPIRAESAQVIAQLQKRNIAVYMCTGDNEMTAYAVASTLGIPHTNVLANVMPAQKAEYIRKIQFSSLSSLDDGNQQPQGKGRKIVAFVGDGTNDSPALTAADVSIAMSSGSDVAISSSSFILLNSNLTTIFELVQLSRRVFNRIKLNFFWAAIYNVILVPVAAGVFYAIPDGTHTVTGSGGHDVQVNGHWRLSPVWASLAMALSSVSVVTSSLALRIEWRDVKRWMKKCLGRS